MEADRNVKVVEGDVAVLYITEEQETLPTEISFQFEDSLIFH